MTGKILLCIGIFPLALNFSGTMKILKTPYKQFFIFIGKHTRQKSIKGVTNKLNLF